MPGAVRNPLGQEVYFVYDELKKVFPAMTFDRLSPRAGILSLRK